MNRKSIASLVTIAALGFGLTACGGTLKGEGTVPSSVVPAPTVTVTAPAPTKTTPAPAKTTPAPADNGNYQFGQTATYKSGLKVTVSKPQAFTPTDEASGGEKSPHHIFFEVTIANGTQKNFDPSMYTSTISSNGKEGDAIFDMERSLNGAPETPVLPGNKITFKDGYGVNNLRDLTMQVSVDFESEPAVFTNAS